MTAAQIVVTGLDAHRPYLLRFAAKRLRRKEDAEDVVQEVCLSALKGADGFAGRSSVRTWLTSILLHKIAHHHRSSAREVSIDAFPQAGGQDGVDALFRENNHCVNMPQDCRNPEDPLTDRRFCDVLEAGLTQLSASARRAFRLRELMGLTGAEICNVLLYRARLRLRAFLEGRGFTAAGRGTAQVSAQGGVRAAQVAARRNSYSCVATPRHRSFTVQS